MKLTEAIFGFLGRLADPSARADVQKVQSGRLEFKWLTTSLAGRLLDTMVLP